MIIRRWIDHDVLFLRIVVQCHVAVFVEIGLIVLLELLVAAVTAAVVKHPLVVRLEWIILICIHTIKLKILRNFSNSTHRVVEPLHPLLSAILTPDLKLSVAINALIKRLRCLVRIRCDLLIEQLTHTRNILAI